jgi:hypothetical protein
VQIFKTKWFVRFARKEGIEDQTLIDAVHEINNGLIDADYGGGLVKKRIARDGGGKSGGYRSIIAYRSGSRTVFMYCFAKSDKANLNHNEITAYKTAATLYLNFTATQIAGAVGKHELQEVPDNGSEI